MAETVVVPKVSPSLALSVPPSSVVGSPIFAPSIIAALSGSAAATGSMAFTVFGPEPSPPSSCASGGTTVGTAPVGGDGAYSPAAGFTPVVPGTYWWYASYGGDLANNSAVSACGLAMEETSVTKARLSLSVSVPARATAGAVISAGSISATLDGGFAQTGTVTFTVFGPQASPPPSCASGGTTVGTAVVSGDGRYQPSAGLTPASAGDYWWYSSYGGDASNSPAASACRPAMGETSVVAAKHRPSTPTLSGVKLAASSFAAPQHVALSLTVSQPATITVAIAQLVDGREQRGACKASRKNGRRCTTKLERRLLTFSARAGPNALRLRLAGLGKGRYTATVTARNANGRSAAARLAFAITRR
jgi:hypothetical protein